MKITASDKKVNLHLTWVEMDFFNQMLEDYLNIIERMDDCENDLDKTQRLEAVLKTVRYAFEEFFSETTQKGFQNWKNKNLKD